MSRLKHIQSHWSWDHCSVDMHDVHDSLWRYPKLCQYRVQSWCNCVVHDIVVCFWGCSVSCHVRDGHVPYWSFNNFHRHMIHQPPIGKSFVLYVVSDRYLTLRANILTCPGTLNSTNSIMVVICHLLMQVILWELSCSTRWWCRTMYTINIFLCCFWQWNFGWRVHQFRPWFHTYLFVMQYCLIQQASIYTIHLSIHDHVKLYWMFDTVIVKMWN